MNTIHVKQQHNVGFFIFKFFPKFMLDNVYINKIHARQCLSIISLYCREGFSHAFICLLHLKESFTLYFKIARKKRFLIGATSKWFRPFQEICNTCVAKCMHKHCIFLFWRFYNFIKTFCVHINSIHSRPLFLYSIYKLVLIFIIFSRFGVSLFN